jgi:hypothetical protein
LSLQCFALNPEPINFLKVLQSNTFKKFIAVLPTHKIAKKNYRLMDIALTGHAVMHCSQTTQRDRKKLS